MVAIKKPPRGGGFFVEEAAITLTARSRKRFKRPYSLTIDLQIETKGRMSKREGV